MIIEKNKNLKLLVILLFLKAVVCISLPCRRLTATNVLLFPGYAKKWLELLQVCSGFCSQHIWRSSQEWLRKEIQPTVLANKLGVSRVTWVCLVVQFQQHLWKQEATNDGSLVTAIFPTSGRHSRVKVLFGFLSDSWREGWVPFWIPTSASVP